MLRQTPLWDRVDRDRIRVAFLLASFFATVTVGLVAVIVGPSVFFEVPDYPPYLSFGFLYALGSVALGVGSFAFFGMRAPRTKVLVHETANPTERLMTVLLAVGFLGLQAVFGAMALVPMLLLNAAVRSATGDWGSFIDWQRVLFALPQAVLICVVWLVAAYNMDGDWAIRHLGARPADPRCVARSAVYGISLAAGLPVPPRVFVMDTPASNAFVLRSTGGAASIAFTRGMLDLLSREELHAVAAVLVARLLRGRIRSTQLLAVLVGPLSLLEMPWRTLQRVFALLRSGDFAGAAASVDDELSMWSIVAVALPSLLLCFWLPVLLGIWYSLTGADTISPVAIDAESLLLGKDPNALCSALGKVSAANPVLPEVSIGFAPLFFAWPRRSPDGWRVERERLEALREVAGASALPAGIVTGFVSPPLAPEPQRVLSRDERLYRACMGDGETPDQ